MPECTLCGKHFPCNITIDGEKHHIAGRKYCLDCSPFNSHNTKRLECTERKKIEYPKVQCETCQKWFSHYGIGSHKWRMHGDGQNFRPTTGKPAWNKGKTKETSESVKRTSEKLRRMKSELELEIDDDNKLKQRWINKKYNAEKEGIKCLLTFEEYCLLVKEAGLKSSQLGFSGEGYVLARYNDTGDYYYGNCRFIKQSKNAKEKKISEKMIETSRKQALKLCETNKLIDRDDLSRRIKEGQQRSEKYKAYIEKVHKQHREKIDKQHIDVHNSQYNTFWITNGADNMKWKLDKGDLPSGYYKGRTMK